MTTRGSKKKIPPIAVVFNTLHVRFTRSFIRFSKSARPPIVRASRDRHLTFDIQTIMPNILLIPTSFERSFIEKSWNDPAKFAAPSPPNAPSGHAASSPGAASNWRIELCGFGLVAAAACAARAIERSQPRRVILMGIAGSLDPSLEIGSAHAFDRVTCHGIGVGGSLDAKHQSADQLGWAHCEAELNEESRSASPAINDTLTIEAPRRRSPEALSRERHLLSVTTASADESEAAHRRALYPSAMAEDMEGFAVALACARACVPLTIVRGISNRAGDRDHARWQVEEAIRAAVMLVKAIT
jgi:futalosine hydrolase